MSETPKDKVDRLQAEVQQITSRLDSIEPKLKEVIANHNTMVENFTDLNETQKEILKVLNETKTQQPAGKAPGGRVSTIEQLNGLDFDKIADGASKLTNLIVDIISKVRAGPADPLADIAMVLYKNEIKGTFKERVMSSKYIPTEERNALLQKIGAI